MQKHLLLCFWGLILSLAIYGQNVKAEKIIVPGSNLINMYKIDTDIYRYQYV